MNKLENEFEYLRDKGLHTVKTAVYGNKNSNLKMLELVMADVMRRYRNGEAQPVEIE